MGVPFDETPRKYRGESRRPDEGGIYPTRDDFTR
jgi:hypothetical protein